MTPAEVRAERPSRTPARPAAPAPALALVVALSVALSGCSLAQRPTLPAPSIGPLRSGALPTAGPTQPAGSGPPAFEPALAAELRNAVDPAAILADLQRLQDLAEANEGHRAAGSPSEAEAARFVADELRAAGYAVEIQEVGVPWFSQDAPSVLEVEGLATPLEDLRDFKATLLSGSGDVRGPIHALAFDPAAAPGDRSGLGCDPADWTGVPDGAIVLVRPGPCLRRDAVLNAQAAGVVALITAYAEYARDSVLRPTLLDPTGIEIPVLAASNAAGLELLEAAQRRATGHVVVQATVELRTGLNVVAETVGGTDDHVLMFGGHLDASIDGPGINDNGSGTMTSLEVARRLAAASAGPQSGTGDGWKVRIGFWTGEEIALLGSTAYTQTLDGDDVEALEAYLNFDMLGSVNGVRDIYGWSQSTRPTESEAIAGLFSAAFERAGLSSTIVDLGGGTDHAPFNHMAIPTGGIFSGANEIKTPEQALLFGGTAGAANDPCYHLACDTVDNIDPVRLEEMARVVAWVVGALASGEVTLRAA